jgi:hypothetical protein
MRLSALRADKWALLANRRKSTPKIIRNISRANDMCGKRKDTAHQPFPVSAKIAQSGIGAISPSALMWGDADDLAPFFHCPIDPSARRTIGHVAGGSEISHPLSG